MFHRDGSGGLETSDVKNIHYLLQNQCLECRADDVELRCRQSYRWHQLVSDDNQQLRPSSCLLHHSIRLSLHFRVHVKSLAKRAKFEKLKTRFNVGIHTFDESLRHKLVRSLTRSFSSKLLEIDDRQQQQIKQLLLTGDGNKEEPVMQH